MKKKSKGYKAGGKIKAKGMMKGGRAMKPKGMKKGGRAMKPKGYSTGGKAKMPMSKDPKTGQMVPTFAMDGKGKMMGGGKVRMTPKGMSAGGAVAAVNKDMKKKSKGMAKGGVVKSKMGSKGGAKGGKTVARGSGAARPQKFGKNG